jgi:hypothetical protein
MPDDGNKLMQIERGIDRHVADAIEIARTGGGFGVVAPRNVGELMEFAKMMAVSGICVRPNFRGNPGACLAITMQAMKWGADPFAVCNKAYVVKNKSNEEQIAYEAQLVHAIVNSSPILQRRLRPHYEGQGQDRSCRIVGYIVGEDEPFEYESPPIKQINPKNSPLWQSDPDQQLFYFSVRGWARRHVPDILMGIYTPDEFHGQTIELEPEPEPRREDFAPPEHLRESGRYYDVTDLDGEVHAFTDPHKATAALRVVLSDASRRDAEALDEAWEMNDGLISGLDERLRSELAGEYTELRDRVLETAQRAAEAAKRQEIPDQAEAADPELTGDDAELDALDRAARVDHELSPPSEQTSQAGFRSVAAPVERPEQGEVSLSPQPSPARGGASPAAEAEERKSTLIPLPLKGGTGKPDHRTWAVALFLPKVRRQTSGDDLAWLMGDNAEAIEACRNGGLGTDDLREFEAAIKAAWERCK